MARNFPHPIPSGWFAVVAAPDLAPGALVRVRAFGRELVAWRGEAGEACVLDAHCPHLGAHLGHGGRVEGDTIVCPFHGWRFGSDGVCRDVPYARRAGGRPPSGARARPWPLVERNGFLWVWHDPPGRRPWYAIPELEEIASPDWQEVHRRSWRIHTQIQEMAENGVDGAHFQAVHGAAALPASEVHVDGATRVAVQRAPLDTSRGRATSVITVRQVGLGLSYTRFTGLCETTSLNVVTPVDASTSALTVVFLQPRDPRTQAAREARAPRSGATPRATPGVTRAIIADLERQIGEDIPIWEHKTYRERPLLCDGDGPIPEFRRWCGQFYSEAGSTDGVHDEIVRPAEGDGARGVAGGPASTSPSVP